MANKQFISSEGVMLGTAEVPDNYEIEGAYEALWRSEMVPIYYALKATREDHRIFMAAYSKELFNDVKSSFLKGIIKLCEASVKSGYEKFMEPQDYLIKEANKIAGVPLKLDAITKLPSPLGNNPDYARALLENDIRLYGTFVEVQPDIVSECFDSVLYRFTGELNNNAK